LAARGVLHSLCCKRHSCKARTYRASELPFLFQKLGRSDEADMMRYALTVGTTADPGVPVHCIFGHNVQTFSYLLANTSTELSKEDVVLDDGDQTVDARSLDVCTRWPSTVKSYLVPGVRHASTMDIKQVNDIIVAVATNDLGTLSSWVEPKISELIYASNHSVAPADELLKVGFGTDTVEVVV